MTIGTRLTTALVGLTGSLVVAAGLSAPPATAAPTTEAAPRKGTLVVTIATPAGVPATVVVRPRTRPAVNSRTLAKPGKGKRVVRRTSLVTGRATVTARDLVHGGRIYRATVGRRSGAAGTTVRAGRTTRVRITYRLLRSAPSFLRATRVERSRVALDWKGLGGNKVRVVRTSGTTPASTPSKGIRIPVKGRTSTDTRVKAGTSYTYALFTKVGRQWAGPITVTVGTPAAAGTSNTTAYELAPHTTVLTKAQVVGTRVSATGLSLRPGAGAPPTTVGQVVAVPRSATLRNGFLGHVTSIATDGTVTLRPATLGEAFTRLELAATLAPAPRHLVRRPEGLRVRALDKEKDTCVESETDADGLEAEFDPYFDVVGSFKADVVESGGWVQVPVGATIDASLTATLGAIASIDADVEASCTIEFLEFEKNIPTSSPVPVVLTFVAHVDMAASGRVAIDAADVSVSATMSFSSTVTTDDVDGSGDWDFGLQAFDAPPTLTAGGEAHIDFGGSLTIGPGTATGFAGATAGVKGTVNPLSLGALAKVDVPVDDVTPVAEPCLSLSVGGNAKLGVTARAWVWKADWEGEFDIPGLSTDWDYGRASWPFECAGARSDVLVIGHADEDGPLALQSALQEQGHSVGLVQPGNLPDLDDYRQVWQTGWLQDGKALRSYVRGGGRLVMIGEPTGRPSRQPASDDEEGDWDYHGGLMASLVKVETGTVWIPHLVDCLCGETITRPVSLAARGGIGLNPNLAPSLRGQFEFAYVGVPEQNALATYSTGLPIATAWDSGDMLNDKGRLVTIATDTWDDEQNIDDNQALLDNIARFMGDQE